MSWAGHRSTAHHYHRRFEFDAVRQFTSLGSTITNNLSLDAEIDKRIETAASTLARLTARVLDKPQSDCEDKDEGLQYLCIGTLLYGSETWTTYAGQTRSLNTYIPPKKHPPYPGHILAGQSNQH